MLDRIARLESERQSLLKEKDDLVAQLIELRGKKVSLEAELSQVHFELEKVAKLKSQEGTCT